MKQKSLIKLLILLVVVLVILNVYYNVPSKQSIDPPLVHFKPVVSPIETLQIPKTVHQTSAKSTLDDRMKSWQDMNPGYDYILWSDAQVDSFVSTEFPEHYLDFARLPKPVYKADLFRYLLLYKLGGIYSDTDTQCLKPISTWTNDAPNMIIGIELDSSEPLPGLKHRLQFVQWTMAASPRHPLMQMVIEHVMRKLQSAPIGALESATEFELETYTGPAIFTEAIYAWLKLEGIEWSALQRLRGPRTIRDVLFLPITSFNPTNTNMGSDGPCNNWAFVMHNFAGSWRADDSKFKLDTLIADRGTVVLQAGDVIAVVDRRRGLVKDEDGREVRFTFVQVTKEIRVGRRVLWQSLFASPWEFDGQRHVKIKQVETTLVKFKQIPESEELEYCLNDIITDTNGSIFRIRVVDIPEGSLFVELKQEDFDTITRWAISARDYGQIWNGAYSLLIVCYLHHQPRQLAKEVQTPIVQPIIHEPTHEGRIPRILHQTGKTGAQFEEKTIVRVNTWKKLNQDWRYRFWTDEEIEVFVRDEFPEYFVAFSRLPRPIFKADVFRYLVILKYGGVYADLDTECLKPISKWTYEHNHVDAIIGMEFTDDEHLEILPETIQFCQWVFAARANHPLIQTVVSYVFERLKGLSTAYMESANEAAVLDITGPVVWTRAVFSYLNRIEKFGKTNLRYMRTSYLYHSVTSENVLVLSTTGFNPTNVWNGAEGPCSPYAMVLHRFSGSWRAADSVFNSTQDSHLISKGTVLFEVGDILPFVDMPPMMDIMTHGRKGNFRFVLVELTRPYQLSYALPWSDLMGKPLEQFSTRALNATSKSIGFLLPHSTTHERRYCLDDLILNGIKQPFVLGVTRRPVRPELVDQLPLGRESSELMVEILEESRRYLSFVSRLTRERKREYGLVWQSSYCLQVEARFENNTCRPPRHFGI
ncbi:hypothetical protein SmJEL517_g05727 [Synchytrium microbalum]|uniref:Alpha 1,4-glycosyltransferase domain-containing protein n=1 Tax=Synchytrium microbalum TaxID=1806994 RepID=A0A507BJQ5_9FUNG|nr:uncharacterized protein SmJEL517_g05727 [Synchytrium microbalum]TPX30800.1 hypothetical protein SmJEL517_g05727 [Synchytrium microbalum]